MRVDKRLGERMGIQPQPGRGEDPLRWNWDSPFIISPHLHTRLYFASNKLYRSDDRGDSWKVISGELSRASRPRLTRRAPLRLKNVPMARTSPW